MIYIFFITILIFSIVIHEVSHGLMAYHLGDSTAKHAGRLTLNPLKHLDPIGSIVVPIISILTLGMGFGWAKPVPINPYNFRDQRWGELKTALAGPVSNIIVAIIFGLIMRLFPGLIMIPGLYVMLSYVVLINILLAVFNLLPIPPLDGSHVLFAFLPPHMVESIKIFFQRYGIFILLFFIFVLFRLLLPIIYSLTEIIIGHPFLI